MEHLLLPPAAKFQKGSAGGLTAHQSLAAALASVADAIASQATSYLSANLLDCWAGMESAFVPNAQNGSHQGLFQLNASAWAASGVGAPFSTANTFNPQTNTKAAVGYLNSLLVIYVGVSQSSLSSGNVSSQQAAQALTDYRWGPNLTSQDPTYASDITKCASDLGAGNWNSAMSDLGK